MRRTCGTRHGARRLWLLARSLDGRPCRIAGTFPQSWTRSTGGRNSPSMATTGYDVHPWAALGQDAATRHRAVSGGTGTRRNAGAYHEGDRGRPPQLPLNSNWGTCGPRLKANRRVRRIGSASPMRNRLKVRFTNPGGFVQSVLNGLSTPRESGCCMRSSQFRDPNG